MNFDSLHTTTPTVGLVTNFTDVTASNGLIDSTKQMTMEPFLNITATTVRRIGYPTMKGHAGWLIPASVIALIVLVIGLVVYYHGTRKLPMNMVHPSDYMTAKMMPINQKKKVLQKCCKSNLIVLNTKNKNTTHIIGLALVRALYMIC